MNDVLVINATYENLGRIAWQRAITLVISEKAIIEDAVPDKFIRHPGGSFPFPKVVRLLRYVKVPFAYGDVPWTKAGVLKRDHYKCAYCEKEADTVDHILPMSRYPELGRDWMNTVAACFKCNNAKSARTPEEAHMVLLIEPSVPKGFHRRRSG